MGRDCWGRGGRPGGFPRVTGTNPESSCRRWRAWGKGRTDPPGGRGEKCQGEGSGATREPMALLCVPHPSPLGLPLTRANLSQGVSSAPDPILGTGGSPELLLHHQV